MKTLTLIVIILISGALDARAEWEYNPSREEMGTIYTLTQSTPCTENICAPSTTSGDLLLIFRHIRLISTKLNHTYVKLSI